MGQILYTLAAISSLPCSYRLFLKFRNIWRDKRKYSAVNKLKKYIYFYLTYLTRRKTYRD
jgi:hypothetical protein